MPQLIELAQNRTLAIRPFGFRRTITVAPIPESVWFDTFFDGMVATLSVHPKQSESQIDVHSAAIALVEKMAVSAEGYPQLEGVADWPSKIPLADRDAYGGILLEAYAEDGCVGPVTYANGTRVVTLQALWSTGPTGKNRRHRHLVHSFKAPSLQQREQVRSAYANVRRINGVTRRGPLVVLSPTQSAFERVLIPLYDQLIAKVEGYAVNGTPLNDNRAEIVRHMDAFHKRAAARLLFLPVIEPAANVEWRNE